MADRLTKSQILAHVAEETGQTKKQVAAVLDSVAGLAVSNLQNGASGEIYHTVNGRETEPRDKTCPSRTPGHQPCHW